MDPELAWSPAKEIELLYEAAGVRIGEMKQEHGEIRTMPVTASCFPRELRSSESRRTTDTMSSPERRMHRVAAAAGALATGEVFGATRDAPEPAGVRERRPSA